MKADPINDYLMPAIGVVIMICLVYYGYVTINNVVDFLTMDLPL